MIQIKLPDKFRISAQSAAIVFLDKAESKLIFKLNPMQLHKFKPNVTSSVRIHCVIKKEIHKMSSMVKIALHPKTYTIYDNAANRLFFSADPAYGRWVWSKQTACKAYFWISLFFIEMKLSISSWWRSPQSMRPSSSDTVVAWRCPEIEYGMIITSYRYTENGGWRLMSGAAIWLQVKGPDLICIMLFEFHLKINFKMKICLILLSNYIKYLAFGKFRSTKGISDCSDNFEFEIRRRDLLCSAPSMLHGSCLSERQKAKKWSHRMFQCFGWYYSRDLLRLSQSNSAIGEDDIELGKEGGRGGVRKIKYRIRLVQLSRLWAGLAEWHLFTSVKSGRIILVKKTMMGNWKTVRAYRAFDH